MSMIVTVHQYDADRNELVCQSDGILNVFRADPFVSCSAKPEDGPSMVGKRFEMIDFWKHKDGCYLCREFKEIV